MRHARLPLRFDLYAGDRCERTEFITGPTIKVGKLSSSHLRLDDDSVSRMHAVIEFKESGSVVLLDLGSAHGTFVNGERVIRRVLFTGDRLRFGAVEAVVVMAGQAEVLPMAAGAAAGVGPSARPREGGLGFGPADEVDGQRRVLEVMALWGTTVVDVRHLAQGSYRIGAGAGADQFVEAVCVGEGSLPLATCGGGEMWLNLPTGAAGEVLWDGEALVDGKAFRFNGLEAAGRLLPGSEGRGRRLLLPPGARCRIELGAVTFLVNSVPAAPAVARLSPWRALDGQLMRHLLIAGFLHFLFVVVALSVPQDADRLTLDHFHPGHRFVAFEDIPVQRQVRPPPDLFGVLRADKGGDQAASALKEHPRADAAEPLPNTPDKIADMSVDARSKEPLQATPGRAPARRTAVPSQHAERAEAGRQAARARAAQTAAAAAAAIGGGLRLPLDANSALGRDAVSSVGLPAAGGVDDGTGRGGSPYRGLGRAHLQPGGGPTDGPVGVGPIATRGGRSGKPGSRSADDESVWGDRRLREPKVVPGKPVISSALDREAVQAVIRGHRGAYTHCFNKTLQHHRDLEGKVVAKFTIGSDGRVSVVDIEESTLGSTEVEQCLTRMIQRWVFPAPKGGGVVVVSYPFMFRAI